MWKLFFTNHPMHTLCLLVVAQLITQSKCFTHFTEKNKINLSIQLSERSSSNLLRKSLK
jgi:hypothetical protein